MSNDGARGRESAHVCVSGEVQGVFFRASTRETALSLGVSGWVRNLPDGRVEAVFEGAADDVHEMVEWCGEGPPGARVTDVAVEASRSEDSGFEGFDIR